MRILHIFNEINFSGAEIMYANGAGLFQQQGFELFAISTGDNFGNYVDEFRKAGIKIYHKPFNPGNLNPVYIWQYFRNITRFTKVNKIDLIHIHRSNVFWYFALCGYLNGKKTVMTLHNVFKAGRFTWFKHYLTRLTARKLFQLTFQSISKSVYYNELNYFKNPTILVNNWYDPERFYPANANEEKQDIRKKLGINKSSLVIISVGRCTAIKNHIDILKALGIAVTKLDIVYLHLGSGETECEEKKVAEALKINDKTHFLGNQVNVRDYYVASDVFVMTSKFEGLGNSCIEAMACGLPCILYDSPGLRDLIANDDNGLLIPPDYTLLTSAIIKFNEVNLRLQKAANALKYVMNNHSMPLCINKIINLYKKCESA